MLNTQRNDFDVPSRNLELEDILLSHALVKDCLVLLRRNLSSSEILVAYVVATQPIQDEDLRSHIKSKGDSQSIPDAFVLINSLPLLENGEADYESLFDLPIVDDDTLKKLGESLNTVGTFSEIRLSEEYFRENELVKSKTKLQQFRASASLERMAEKNNSNILSLVHGPSLKGHKIAESLCNQLIVAAKEKTKGIHFINKEGDDSFYSYSSLMEDAKKILSGLNSFGVSAKDKVLLQIGDHQDLLVTFWACLLGGIIPLPIAPLSNDDSKSSQVAKLFSAWEVLERPRIVSDKRTKSVLKNLLLEGKDECIVSVENLRGFDPVESFPEVNGEDIALLLLTSGSTGIPKIVTQTHKALTHRSYAAALMNAFNRDDIFLNWFPLDHVGGIVMFHVQALAVIADQVQATMGRILSNPLEWLNLIEKYKATVTWAPNFAYGLANKAINQSPSQKWNLSTMRFILNGGEAICSDQAMTFLKNLSPFGLPKDCMRPSWGMSETCSGVTFSDSFVKHTNKSSGPTQVGVPIAGVSFRIVDESGTVVTEGNIGALEVRGDPITQGYYRNEAANEASFSTDGWFRTGDKAVIENGELTITGRDKDIIIINGLNHSCSEIESTIEELDAVKSSFTAAIGVRYENSTTDHLVIFFVPNTEDPQSINNCIGTIRRTITHRFNILPEHVIPVQQSDIPKTSIGKIQRSLLKDRFQTGVYDTALRLMDPSSLLSNVSYSDTWQQRTLLHYVRLRTKFEKYLIVTKTSEISLELAKELEDKGYGCYLLEYAEAFEKVTDHHMKVNPRDAKQTAKKIETILDEHNITTIVDLRSLDNDIPSQKTAEEVISLEKKICSSALSLLRCIKKGSAVKRIIYCTNYSQKVCEKDKIIPAKSAILGILKAAGQERAQLLVKHIDLAGVLSAQSICMELSDSNKAIEVAYRGKKRYVRGLQPVVSQPFRNSLAQAIKEKGLYVITGGLGGIGFELAKRLLQTYEVKLLLIGRTEMPDRHLWQQYLEDGFPEAEKIKALKQLQSMRKGQVLYASGDVSDTNFIQGTLDQAKAFYDSPVDGIFHLAGTFEERSLNDCDEEHLNRVLKAKTLGAWNLYEYALSSKYPLIFVTFSSANGYFSGPNVGVYSAANVYLEALATQTSFHIRHYCFSWSMWEDMGMSNGYAAKELTELRGYKLLKSEEALDAMFDAMTQAYSSMMIGIDGHNPYMQAYITTPIRNQKRVKIEYQLADPTFQIELPPANLDSRDSFGNELSFDFHNMTNSDKSQSNSSSKDFATTLTSIWETVLEIDNITQNDNFFDLGGYSLLMIKVREKIKEKLSIDIEMLDLFKFPTIKSLSNYLFDQARPGINIYEVLNDIWSEVLEFDDFSREDNFFDLGGYSLLMIKVRERINQSLGLDVEMIDLFKYPTLKDLSQFLERKRNETLLSATPVNTNSLKKIQRRYRRQ